MIPENPVMLLSFVNTQLRDHYSNLEDFCDDYQVDMVMIKDKLASINYFYDEIQNQFK